MRSELAVLKSKCLDIEAKSRPSSVIFFGSCDTARKSWTETADRVTKTVSEKLVPMIPPHEVTGHTNWMLKLGKSPPIIVNFTFLMKAEKSHLIIFQRTEKKSLCSERRVSLTDSLDSQKKRLLEPARPQGTGFKLRYDKLGVGNA